MKAEDLLAELLKLVDKDTLREMVKPAEPAKQMLASVSEDDAELSPEESRSVICIGDDANVKDQPWSKLHEPEIVGVRVDREDDELLMSIQSKFQCYSTGIEAIGVDPFDPEEERVAEKEIAEGNRVPEWDFEEAKRCRKAMFAATVRKDVGFKAKPVTNGGSGGELSRAKDWSKSEGLKDAKEIVQTLHITPPGTLDPKPGQIRIEIE